VKPENVPGWGGAGEEAPAQAEIEFECGPGGRTYVSRSRVGYPFHVGGTLDFPGDPPGMASLYLQSCSGGVFEDERLGMRIHAAARTQAHVSTGASTIVHAMPRGHATQSVHLAVEDGALLEYLPEPGILFPGAKLLSSVLIDVDPGAVLIASEMFLFHDPAGTGRRSAYLQSGTAIRSRGVLLARDRLRLDEAALVPRPGVLGNWQAQGTLFFASPGSSGGDLIAIARAALAAVEGIYAGASRLPNECGVWARILAPDAVALRTAMHACWSAMRERLTGLRPAARRK
jgi:urease accessory protein